MKRKQSGMTLIGFLVVLAVVGFAAYIGMKLFPMYQEYHTVRSIMKSLAAEPGIGDMDPHKIQTLISRRLSIDYVDNVKSSDFKFERMEGGWLMKIDYEVRRPLVGNLDIVGKFDRTQALTRKGSAE
jgi:hypothetical protein